MNTPLARSWENAVQLLREDENQIALVQAAYFDDPLLQAAIRYWRSEEWAAIRPFLPEAKGQALDVGAGRGIASYALAKDGFEVTALEPDGSALVGAGAIQRLARESTLPIRVVRDFSQRLPFPDAFFRVVFARAVLHHIDDMSGACREFFRVLQPGGCLIAVREHVISRQEDLHAFLDSHPLHKLYGGENAFLLEQYVEAIQNAGFEIQDILMPFRSPVNLAPHTKQTIQTEIAAHLFRRAPIIARLATLMLKAPGMWMAVLPLLERFDNRPGRLYSFIARKK